MNMKKFLISLVMLFGLWVSAVAMPADSASVRDWRDSIRVALVTCSPGTEVYAVYGHTALRIEIPSVGVDLAINYGLFSFDAPNFVWRFIKGETDYVVGAIAYPIFESEYTERGSRVTLQYLNLSVEEKVRLIRLLDDNLRPENREYRYNFLYNNCSTKALDKIEEALTVRVEPKVDARTFRSLAQRGKARDQSQSEKMKDESCCHPDAHSPLSSFNSQLSYRSILHEYTAPYPWLQFGVDYLLGLEADRPIGMRQQVFAPEFLMRYVEGAAFVSAGKEYPCVIDTEVVEPVADKEYLWQFPLEPVQAMVLLLLFVAVVCTVEVLLERRQWWLDLLLFTVQGLMGIVVAFLFLVSEHPTVGTNLHVIYLNPLPLLLMPLLLCRTDKRGVKIAYCVIALLVLVFVVVSLLLCQYIQPAAYLFAATLLLRVLHNLWMYPVLKRCFGAKSHSSRKSQMVYICVAFVLAMCIPQRAVASGGEAPKVVVGIVVDQLRADYLEKYSHLYGEDGFKKLFAEGRVYTNAYFSHANPDRSSAIASVYSGSTPYYHGVTGNRFLERKSLRVKSIVDDAAYAGINTTETASPANLLVTTLPDELKMATKGHAYILSVAPQRDMAVLAGGHAPNAVMWLDEGTAMWASSTYYNGVPAWVRPYNHRMGTTFDWNNVEWEPYYPTGVYSYSAYDGVPKAFRYVFRGGDAETVKRYKTSACINDEVTQLAKTCIAGSLFGRNKTTDMLCVGYYAGNYEHASEWERPLELQDIYCRLDRNIAELIESVDEKVGIENALFFITSTGYVDAHKPDDKLFSLPTGELRMERCVALLNIYLGALYGKDAYVEASYLNEIYLNHALVEKRQLKLTELLDRCTEFLSQVAGVKRVYPSLDLLSGAADADMRGACNSERSGDLILEVSPGWTLVDERWGERVYYNRSHIPVPIILYGADLTPAVSRTPISVESIAPTVAHILRISAPNACSERPVE